MAPLILRLPRATSSVVFLSTIMGIVAVPTIPIVGWMIWGAATGAQPWTILIAAGAILIMPGIVVYALIRALMRRAAARALLNRAGACDEHRAEALALLGGCNLFGTSFFPRRLLDRHEAATGRRLPRIWIFGDEAAAQVRRLCSTDGRAPEDMHAETGDPLYRARTRPWPPHVKWMILACVLGVVGSVILLRLTNRNTGVHIAMYAVVIGGGIGCRSLFKRAGWWARPVDGRLEVVRRDRRGSVVERRALDDPDPLIIVHQRVMGGRRRTSSRDAMDLGWVIVPSAGPKIEIDDVDPVFTPWAEALVVVESA